MNEVAHAIAFQRKVWRWRMFGWGFIALAGIAAICLLQVVSAKGGIHAHGTTWQETLQFGSMVVGLVALVVGPFMLVQIGQQITFYDAVMSGRSPVLARWRCTPEEVDEFIAMEAARLKVSRRRDIYLALLIAPAALAVISLRHSIEDWTLVAIAGGGAILGYILWRINGGVEFRAAKRRANTEIVVAEEGMVAGPDVFIWRSLNCGLAGASYEAGEPDVLTLTFRAGTMPGGKTLQAAKTAAYIAGNASSPGVTASRCFNVRVPVTAAKEERIRGLVSSTLKKHLLKKNLIP